MVSAMLLAGDRRRRGHNIDNRNDIIIIIINPHLGLIKAPPLFVFLATTFFTIHLLSKRPDMY